MPTPYFRAIYALSSALQHVNHIRPVITYLENHPPIEELLFHDLSQTTTLQQLGHYFSTFLVLTIFQHGLFLQDFARWNLPIAMVQYHYFYWRSVSKTCTFNSPDGVTSILLLLHPNIPMTLFRS